MKKNIAKFIAAIFVMTVVASTFAASEVTSFATTLDDLADTTAVDTEETTTGGTLTIGSNADLLFTPSWMLRAYTDRAIWSLVYEPLVKLDENGDWYPFLLESLTPDPENLTWTCVVKDGVTFSDGTPFDGDALLWNFENYLENSNTSTTHFGFVDSFEKTDDKTVVIHLKQWTSQIPYSFQDNCGYMYSPKAYSDNGAEWCDTHAVGTGPYIQDEFEVGSYRNFVKNENYWNKDEAEGAYDMITWKVIGDESTAQAALISGEIDGYFNGSFLLTDTMLNAVGGFYQAMNTTTFMVQFLIPPSAVEGSGWEDENVRKAAYYAIDSQAIIDAVTYGLGIYSNQYAGPGSPYYNDEISGYDYDVEKAKELMAQSAYPDGFKTKYYASNENPLYSDVGIALKDMLSEIGIEVEITLVEPSVWMELFRNAEDGFILAGHGFGMNLANQMLSNFSQAAADGVGMMAYVMQHPQDLNDTIVSAVSATDTETMVENIKASNVLITDEYALAYPLYLSPAYFMVWSDRVVDTGCFNNTSLSFDYTKIAPAAG